MRWPGRIAACVLALALVLGATTLTHPEPTEASFTDAEAAGGALSAATGLPAPVQDGTPGCVAGGRVSASRTVTITWQVPAGTSYTNDDLEFGQLNSHGLLVPIIDLELFDEDSEPVPPMSYSTSVSGPMLQGLLERQKLVGIRFKSPGNWSSPWLVATATWGVLGIGNTCTMSTVPAT